MSEAQQTPAIVKAWYRRALWLWLLWPLSLLFRLIAVSRRVAYRNQLFASWRAPVPVIVVGNISVGGTGKTPVVIALVQALQQAGFKPGVISRGYGSDAPGYPFAVKADSQPTEAGDEPLLIAKRTQAPLVIDANRGRAGQQLLNDYSCDVIVTDDGLQHYALARDIELVVVDSQRGFGNGQCLPMGPLREPLSRLKTVDYVIGNGAKIAAPVHSYAMQLQAGQLVNLINNDSITAVNWSHSKRVHAVAGIGNPGRFFKALCDLGFEVIEHVFADHHAYQPQDIEFGDQLPVIMTEKDAVKIQGFANQQCWYLPVDAVIDNEFYELIIQRLKAL